VSDDGTPETPETEEDRETIDTGVCWGCMQLLLYSYNINKYSTITENIEICFSLVVQNLSSNYTRK